MSLEEPRELRRRIGLPAAAALVVGGTIGVGIFLTPAGMAAALASPGLLLAVWVFVGGSAFCGALCFGELGARYPMAGGGYVYLREAFGPRLAFLYGWKCLLVMDPGLTAALATGLGAYAAVVAPGLPPKAVALGAIVLVALVNATGVRMAAGVGYALGVAKIVMLVSLVVFGFASGAGQLERFLPFAARQPGAPALLPALAGALVSAFFSFGGWWEASKLAGEVRDPQRTLPRALALGVATVTALYVAVSAVFLYLVPRGLAASGETFAAEAGAVLFGAQGARAFSALVVVSVLGSLFAFMTMAPRVYFAMARDGAVPAFVGRLHARTGAPVRAIAVQASLALVIVALGTFDAIVAYFVFVTVAFLGLTVCGLVRLKRRQPPASYETPLYPLPPVLFLASITVVLVLLAAGRPWEAALGVAVVAAGVPAYALLRGKAGA